MNASKEVQVAVDGYGVIGERVADAISERNDMQLTGVGDVVADWRPCIAVSRGMAMFGATVEYANAMPSVVRTVSALSRRVQTCMRRLYKRT